MRSDEWSISWERGGWPTFQLMDHIGLDVVLDIEERYAVVRDGIPQSPRTLLQDYINRGRLGVKTGHGFFDYT
jgi:3-hydroxybutyryl-CoA dehydrogenase